MRILLITFVLALIGDVASAQQFMTREGRVHFFSTTPVEDIEAINEQTTAMLTAEGQFAFRVPILGFRFEKALMEEHFNENYMESTTYPNGTFEGKVANWSNGWNDGATHEVVAAGALTIHGVTVEREIPATIKWNGKAWEIESMFNVSPTDHAIEIPKMVRNKIAESLEVTVNAALAPR